LEKPLRFNFNIDRYINDPSGLDTGEDADNPRRRNRNAKVDADGNETGIYATKHTYVLTLTKVIKLTLEMVTNVHLVILKVLTKMMMTEKTPLKRERCITLRNIKLQEIL